VHSYSVVYLSTAALFGFGAVLAALLFRRRAEGASLARAAEPVAVSTTDAAEPVGVA
jgi:hypothetical protein